MKRFKVQYAYIVLVVLSMMIAVAAVLLSLEQVKDNQFKFCQLVIISNQYPVPEPPGVGSTPVKDRAWAMFNEYNAFGRSLGCPEEKS